MILMRVIVKLHHDRNSVDILLIYVLGKISFSPKEMVKSISNRQRALSEDVCAH